MSYKKKTPEIIITDPPPVLICAKCKSPDCLSRLVPCLVRGGPKMVFNAPYTITIIILIILDNAEPKH